MAPSDPLDRRTPAADWQHLNAYADGELGPEERAAFAERLAADRDLARQAAALVRLQAETQGAFADISADIPDPDLGKLNATPGDRLNRRWIAAAAALLLAVLAGSVVLFRAGDPAVEAHRRWIAAAAVAAPEVVSAGLPVRPGAFPNLEAAGLRAVHAVRDGEALHVGYAGPRGCRVSLWIEPGRGEASPAIEASETLQIARWRGRGLSYVLVASGMPVARFALLAGALGRAGSGLTGTEEEQALMEAKSGGARCTG